jgi:hypothetical protein
MRRGYPGLPTWWFVAFAVLSTTAISLVVWSAIVASLDGVRSVQPYHVLGYFGGLFIWLSLLLTGYFIVHHERY